jgi:MinD superfamily P-loop ATPase
MIHEVAVLSGKGGTGKTTLTLSLIPYMENFVVADCDVDAPDLHLVLRGKETKKLPYYGLKKPFIDKNICTNCGLCTKHCNFHAIDENQEIALSSCEGCGVCQVVCPLGAITMVDTVIGHITHKDTEYGPFVDAKLIPGEEASGKLVAEVRAQARQVAEENQNTSILIDGSPGVGCNVMSTITGVDQAILVTEPSASGFHDLKRIVSLAKMVSVPVVVVINKYTNSPKYTKRIEDYCLENKLNLGLKIPYDPRLFQAINRLEIPSLTKENFFASNDWLNFLEKIKVVNINAM